MSPPFHCIAVLLIIGVCNFPNNVNARYYKRVYQEDQSQDLYQNQQRPQLQTKPLLIDTQQNQQRPQLQTKPFYFDGQTQQTQQQNQRPGQQINRPQQKPDQGQLSQSQQRPQVVPISQQSQVDDFSDEDENELQQNLVPQIGGLDSNQQTQFLEDIDKYTQELDTQSQISGHKGKVTKDDVEIVQEKNERKPWYVRLKNWGNKKYKEVTG